MPDMEALQRSLEAIEVGRGELREKRARLMKVEAALVDLLRAPYMEWYPFAISRACALMDHPSRWPDERRPKYKDEQCVCGTRKEP